MKYILVIMLMLSLNVSADYVKNTMAVCPDEETVLDMIHEYQVHDVSGDAFELEMWLMGHNCKIIDNKTPIEVLDYTGKKIGIIKLKLKKDGDIVFGQGKDVQIEQSGDKNTIYKF